MSQIAYSFLLSIFLLTAWPSWAQRSGAPASQPPVQPGGLAPQPTIPNQPSTIGAPRYIDGRVLMESGQPISEAVSVGLNCGTTSLQVIRTDVKGYFRFTLDAGPQSNMDLSAADDAPAGMNGMNSASRFGSVGATSRGLVGCELRVSASGYQPLTNTIADPYPNSLGTIDVGTLQLKRMTGLPGSSVAVTSLLVPGGAHKEYEKGVAEARSNRPKSATQHLEKAIAKYDKYAAAWYELGKVYSADQEMEKARQAFDKAISADPEYIPPYLSLASMAIQNREYENAVAMAGKALEVDPAVGAASYLQAIANFNLHRLDAAEKNAREADKASHQSIPRLHVLLADILLQKQDYSGAAMEIRTYLKESPGQPASEIKQKLDQIEKLAASAKNKSELLAMQQQTPPAIENVIELEPPQAEQVLPEKPLAQPLALRGKRVKTDLWYPPDVSLVTPEVAARTTCSLPDVLSNAGKRIEELLQNVDKFTATEIVEHQSVNGEGRLGPIEIRKFNYLVTMAQSRSGGINVEEYRDGGSSADRFPAHIGTVGTPSLVLIFHPRYSNNFQMKCEGLGEWRGRPAWLVRFEERSERSSAMTVIDIGSRSFALRLHGRAWILADSYQVAHLESDLAEQVPKIRLRLQHQNVDYRAVPAAGSKNGIWLPASTEMYMDFLGHRFYRRHYFTDMKFFSVKVQQTFGDPKE